MLPDGFHLGFGAASPVDLIRAHANLWSAGVPVGDIEDFRPEEEYVTFRCCDPDRTDSEIFARAANGGPPSGPGRR